MAAQIDKFSPPPHRILVVSPHTDDAELACGASIARWVEESREVRVLHLSDTRNINGDDFGNRLKGEASAAGEHLGLRAGSIHFSTFPTRDFARHRQEILDFLIVQRDAFRPDLVVGPHVNDSHQDHSVVAEEISRAFKDISILRFDTFWNLISQDTNYIVEIHQRHLESKLAAIKEYVSQEGRPYVDEQVIRSLARVRGLPRGFQFAESFSCSQTSVGLFA